MGKFLGLLASVAIVGCSSPRQPGAVTPARANPSAGGSLARVYYWRAKPGKLAEYTRYIREVAAPIDEAARQRGAFISVTTYVSRDSTIPWTHMRIFVLRDSAQLAGLSAELTSAGLIVEPDSAKRRQQSEYSATLRDRVGDAVLDILR